MWFRNTAKKRRVPSAPSRRPRLEALEDRCLLSAGALDPTFGNGAGYVATALSSGTDWGEQVLLQPSSNIVVAGDTTIPVTTTTTLKGKTTTTTTTVQVFGVVTYNPDGTLDTAFGSGGIVAQPFVGQGKSGASLLGAALEPTGPAGDDKILLAGWDQAQGGLALMRLNANGSLDTTFGDNGQVITPFQTSGSVSSEKASGVAVTSSGQIVAVGYDNSQTVLLARYNPDGSLDTTFGNGGKATTLIASTGTNFQAQLSAMAQQPDGKLVVVGTEQWYVSGTGTIHQGMVLRYSANGSLDMAFGKGGIVSTVLGTGIGNFNKGVAVYPNGGTANDGKIVVASGVTSSYSSASPSEWAVERYNPNGSVDTTFNGAGYVTIYNPQQTGVQSARAVALDSTGKPIVVGYVGSIAVGQVARLNADGSLDATFGNGGLVTTAVSQAQTEFAAVAIQPDGQLVAAGDAVFQTSTKRDFLVARYLPSEPQIGSFAASPNPVTSGTSTTLTALNITDGNVGSTVTQVAFYYYDGTGTKQVLGYGTQTSPGVWTLNFTVNLAPGTYTLYAQAEDSYGVLGDPLALTLTVQ